jgi:hypothetical protein
MTVHTYTTMLVTTQNNPCDCCCCFVGSNVTGWFNPLSPLPSTVWDATWSQGRHTSMHLLIINPSSCKWIPLGVQIFLAFFISFPYMFRATMCPSSEETTVFMRHLILAILYGCLSGMQGRIPPCIPDSYFSWWWVHSCPKHVEKRNKHTKKIFTPRWLYSQDSTRIHGQQNVNN